MTSWDSLSSVEPKLISGLLHKATSLEFPGSRRPPPMSQEANVVHSRTHRRPIESDRTNGVRNHSLYAGVED
jgi:hypothetical protein